MAYTLAVANVVELPVKFSVNDGGKTTPFAFHIRANRMAQDEIRRLLKDEFPLRDLLLDQIVGWRGQRLVLDESGEPAAFSREALDCMMSLVGMEGVLAEAYLRGMGVEAAAVRAKN